MTVDPRTEAAARVTARRYTGDEEAWPSYKGLVAEVLAAADAVERPVATRLADALKACNRYLGSALAYREAHEGLPLGTIVTESAAGQAWCVAAVALAEWDATQEPT